MLFEDYVKVALNLFGSTLSLGYFVLFFLDYKDFAIRHWFLFCSGLSNCIITIALWFEGPNEWILRVILIAYVGCLLSILTSSVVRYWGVRFPFSFPRDKIHMIIPASIVFIRSVSLVFGCFVPLEKDVLGLPVLPLPQHLAFAVVCLSVVFMVVGLNLLATKNLLNSPKYQCSPVLASIRVVLKAGPKNEVHSSLRIVVNSFVTNVMFLLCWMPIVVGANAGVIQVAIHVCELLSLCLYSHLMGHSLKRVFICNLVSFLVVAFIVFAIYMYFSIG